MMLTEVTAVPIIVAIVELLKNAGVPNRILPLLDLVLGVGAGVVLYPENLTVAVTNGVVLGLAAAGLYRGAKVTLKGE